ncbi:hypothetical protein GGS26DRAFT_598386 [Hypomontagnella submonticulosa]|nr:hypothetical protein GGS26DRAFT_598386 [Hypomontagnella submonticulosa]
MFSAKVLYTLALAVIPSLTAARPHCYPPTAELDGRGPGDDYLGIWWAIVSDNINIDSQYLRLRSDNTVVTDDNNSRPPKLFTDYRGGALYSAIGANGSNTPFELGPTGLLRSAGQGPGFTKYALMFEKTAEADVDKAWYMETFDLEGWNEASKLAHPLPQGKGQADFLLCPEGEGKTKIYHVYYLVSDTGHEWDDPACEIVIIQARYSTAFFGSVNVDCTI